MTRTSRRRAIALGAGLSVAPVLLAACGGAAGGGASSGAKTDLSKVNRKLLVWGDAKNEVQKAQVARWSQMHPNLQTELADIGSTGQGSDAISKFLAAVAGGDVADVVRFDRFQIGSYAYRGAFTPLDTYQKTDKFDLKRFVPGAVDEATGVDKKLYGVPNSVDTRPFFWNKMHFREIAANPDNVPTTWDQLKEYALKLTRQNATTFTRIGWTYGGNGGLSGSSLTYLMGFINQAEFMSKDGKKTQLNHPKVVEAMQWVFDLLEAEGGTQRHEDFKKASLGGSNENHAMFGQLMSMGPFGHSFLGTIAGYKPDFDFGIGNNPVHKAGDPPASWSGGFAWIMPKGIKNPEISWEMIKDFVSSDSIMAGNQNASTVGQSSGRPYVPGMSGQPDVDKAAFDKYKTNIPAVDKGLQWAVDSMKVTKFRPVTPAAVDLYDGANNAWNDVLAKKKTVKQAYDDANAVAQQALDTALASAGAK